MGLREFFQLNSEKRQEMREQAKAWNERDKTREAGTTSWCNPRDTHYRLGDHVEIPIEFENPNELLAAMRERGPDNHPDEDCFTLENGECVAEGPCMHRRDLELIRKRNLAIIEEEMNLGWNIREPKTLLLDRVEATKRIFDKAQDLALNPVFIEPPEIERVDNVGAALDWMRK